MAVWRSRISYVRHPNSSTWVLCAPFTTWFPWSLLSKLHLHPTMGFYSGFRVGTTEMMARKFVKFMHQLSSVIYKLYRIYTKNILHFLLLKLALYHLYRPHIVQNVFMILKRFAKPKGKKGLPVSQAIWFRNKRDHSWEKQKCFPIHFLHLSFLEYFPITLLKKCLGIFPLLLH